MATSNAHQKSRWLVICGDYDHFRGAVLSKIDSAHFRFAEFADWLAMDRPELAAFLRWAPFSEFVIPGDMRRLIPAGTCILNDRFNCGKDNVHRHFSAVFGRRVDVDPLEHRGIGVVKSKRNAAHDGAVTTFPQSEVMDDKVYEKLIDNRHDDKLVVDIRLPLIFGKAPLAYLKYRPIESRFKNQNAYCKLVTATDVLSGRELELCADFTRSIGLDYGELDVLRDRNSQQIFIVDANNTPHGPPNGLPGSQGALALEILGEACASRFFAL
jgi:hypothetical protein